MTTDPAFLTAVEAARAIQKGALSPVDLVEALLARIGAYDGKLHAFTEVYADEARLAAEAADKAIRAGHATRIHGCALLRATRRRRTDTA